MKKHLIRLPDDEWQILKKRAKLAHRTATSLALQYIRAYLRDGGKSEAGDRQEAREQTVGQ